MTVTAYDTTRRTNARAITDLAELGHLQPGDRILDATYCTGRFWKQWHPAHLIAGDLDPQHARDVQLDATHLPFPNRSFDVVVFDPPYKMVGTPRLAMDAGYGINGYQPTGERFSLLQAGTLEAIRVARRAALVKCMDQICGGRQQWQTVEVHLAARSVGAEVDDELHVIAPVPQDPRRRQEHVHGRGSTFVVITPAAKRRKKAA